jgi:acyl carrier protein
MTKMEDNIKEILKEIRSDVDFNSSENFIDEELLDSLDMIKLISLIDNKFEISIEAEDIVPENFISINTINNLINKYLL